MVISNIHKPKTLQLALYSGVALVVISMLFLGRQQQSTSFWVQAFTVLAVPCFFYVVGGLVWRYLHTPLAAPGLIATGAWLIGVGLIHLYEKQHLLPLILQPFYWFGASVLAGSVITLTGHRVRIWMLVPLVPLVQTNAVWAIMGVLGVPVQWMPVLTFLLILAWWELPIKDERWTTVYRTSGVLLTLFVLLFSLWLPLMTQDVRLLTWAVGAIVVAILGFRHGWARTGPLAIILLVCASIWGLPSSAWPLAWLSLALLTVVFIERLVIREGKDAKTVEISEALAVLLSGISALVAQFAATFNAGSPLTQLITLLGGGILMLWLGWRRNLLVAMHIGLWMLACAWALLYFLAMPGGSMLGLWLSLFATFALLVERLLSSHRKDKLKDRRTLTETVVRWPVADLVIGLSAIIISWAAININTAPAHILAITSSVVVGIWIAAGLFYRLPILLHIALWIAPLPYMLLLLITAPAIWSLPLMGVAWQFLGIIFLVLGHSLVRYRPAILAPFFIVGYVLIGFGFTFTAVNDMLLPLSLGIIVLASIATSITVIVDYHPAWSVFLSWLLPHHRLPFAYKHFNHLFLFLAAWLSAIWLHLMLGHTGMSLSRQGMFLVGFAGLWFVLGRILSRLPGVVGWPVVGAGWFMWLIGLLEVFFSPTEAIITMILGLVISGEALRRSRAAYWIPIFIVQIFFTLLQIVWMLSLPGSIVLMLVAVGVGIGGMIYERRTPRDGRIITVTGALLAFGIFFFQPNVYTLLGLNVLAVAATLIYRRWQWLCVVYLGIGLLILQSRVNLDWRILTLLGLAQWVIGAELVRALRPRRFRKLSMLLFREIDWATPFLWMGTALTLLGLWLSFNNGYSTIEEQVIVQLLTAAVIVFSTLRLRVRNLPYIALFMLGFMLIESVVRITRQPLDQIGNALIFLMLILAGFALAVRWYISHQLLTARQPFPRSAIWWIRPLLKTSQVLSALAFLFLAVLGSVYHTHPALRIITSLVLLAYPVMLYLYYHNRDALLGALLLAGCTWFMAVDTLNLNGVLWYTIPIGIGLLGLARLVSKIEYAWLEWGGVAALVLGSAAEINIGALQLTAVLPLALHLIALAIYGFAAGRRIPFIGASIIISAGLLFTIARINIWLIPLGCGVALLSLTILAEARADYVTRFTQSWTTRWQSWK